MGDSSPDQKPQPQPQPQKEESRRRPPGLVRGLTMRMKYPSTRDNSMYKWQTDDGIVGCLEVPSEPAFDYSGVLKPMHGLPRDSQKGEKGRDYGKELISSFDRANAAWVERGLRETFVEACDSLPKSTLCCGMLQDDDKTVRDLVPHLNQVWSARATEKMRSSGFGVDAFLWSWNNLQGKSETYVLLVRFHDLAKCKCGGFGHNKRRYSSLGKRNSRRNSSTKSLHSAVEIKSLLGDSLERTDSKIRKSTAGNESTQETVKKSNSQDSSSFRTDVTSSSRSSLRGSSKSLEKEVVKETVAAMQ